MKDWYLKQFAIKTAKISWYNKRSDTIISQFSLHILIELKIAKTPKY